MKEDEYISRCQSESNKAHNGEIGERVDRPLGFIAATLKRMKIELGMKTERAHNHLINNDSAWLLAQKVKKNSPQVQRNPPPEPLYRK